MIDQRSPQLAHPALGGPLLTEPLPRGLGLDLTVSVVPEPGPQKGGLVHGGSACKGQSQD